MLLNVLEIIKIMKKNTKIVIWVIVIVFILWLIYRWNQGYFTLGYVPLAGLRKKQTKLCYDASLPNCTTRTSVGCYREC